MGKVTKAKAKDTVKRMLQDGLGLSLNECDIVIHETVSWGIKKIYEMCFINSEHNAEGSTTIPSFVVPCSTYEEVSGCRVESIETYLDQPGVKTYSANNQRDMIDVVKQLLEQGAIEVPELFYVIDSSQE